MSVRVQHTCPYFFVQLMCLGFHQQKLCLKLGLTFQRHANANAPFTVSFYLLICQINVYLFVDMIGRLNKKQLITIHGVKVEEVHL